MSLTAEQIQERKSGLFATDAAPVLGLSKYSTPVQVWLEKTGQTEPRDLSDNEAVQMGHVMEPVIARLYEDRTGLSLDHIDYGLRHKDFAFMGSHFDYKIAGKPQLVECKNFSSNRVNEFGENGTDEVPMDVLLQCVHEAAVFNVEFIDVAVLFGGQKFCIYPLHIDDASKTKLITLEEEFWRKHVVEMTPPEPRTEEETRMLFKKDNGQVVIAPTDIQAAVTRLSQIADSIKQMEEAQDGLKVLVQSYMGESAVLAAQDGTPLVTWKKSKDGVKFDSKMLEKAMPHIYNQFQFPTVGSRRFLLKV